MWPSELEEVEQCIRSAIAAVGKLPLWNEARFLLADLESARHWLSELKTKMKNQEAS